MPSPQVLAGDLEEAICTHALYYSIWRRYDALPERFDWHNKVPNTKFYPLRPELVESTYLLYQVVRVHTASLSVSPCCLMQLTRVSFGVGLVVMAWE